MIWVVQEEAGADWQFHWREERQVRLLARHRLASAHQPRVSRQRERDNRHIVTLSRVLDAPHVASPSLCRFGQDLAGFSALAAKAEEFRMGLDSFHSAL
jgi:hypothetical protein